MALPNSTISRSPRLAVLVGGVVGYVDFLPAGTPLVTFVQKPRGLVEGHAFKEAGDSGILVSPHAVREHGVVERVVRIVLGGDVLADDGVGGQVEQQPHLPRFEKGGELLPDSAVGNDYPDDEEGPHAQAPADAADAAFPRQMDARQVFPEIRIRYHEPVRVQLAYGHALRIGDPLLLVVRAVIFVVDVRGL